MVRPSRVRQMHLSYIYILPPRAPSGPRSLCIGRRHRRPGPKWQRGNASPCLLVLLAIIRISLLLSRLGLAYNVLTHTTEQLLYGSLEEIAEQQGIRQDRQLCAIFPARQLGCGLVADQPCQSLSRQSESRATD